MTRARKLKKAIRARARKTGESYTAARRQYLKSRAPAAQKTAAATPRPARRPSSLGAVSDSKCRERTGHGLQHWFKLLDAFGAPEKGHTAAARFLYESGVPDWYCQGVTVAYERTRGLRAVNQSCEGRFQVSVSRVVPAPVAEVVRQLSIPERRARWLSGAEPALVRALAAAFEGPKARGVTLKSADHARMRYRWDGSTVEIRINARPGGKASIVADNKNLVAAEAVEPRRAAWGKALDALRNHLAR